MDIAVLITRSASRGFDVFTICFRVA